MRRHLILALALLIAAAVGDARAQSAAPPVEVGLDVSIAPVSNGSDLHAGPRLVVNFDGHNAMQFTASLQKLSPWDDAQKKTDLYLAVYRRLVHASGPIRVSATLGGGLERTVIVAPGATFGDPPVTVPASRGVEVLPAFTTGGAIDFRLGHRAAIVVESSFVLANSLGGRLSAGLIVPVGSYPSRDQLAASVPWAELDAGERAWVTTGDGREVDGEVVSRSASTLTLRTPAGIVSLTADDVRAIDTTDPIRNGTMIGMAIGGLAALLPSIFVSSLACLDRAPDECGIEEMLSLGAIVTGLGAGIGAATGALTDSLRERRVPLFRRGGSTSVTLAPVVSAHRLGARAVVRW